MNRFTTGRGRRGRRTVLLALVLALVLAACGSGDDSGSDAEAQPLTIAHPGNMPTIWVSAQIYVAEHFGFFDEWDVDVTIRPMGSGGDVVQATFTREIDGGHTGTEPFLTAAAAGVDLKAIMGENHQDWILVSKDPAVQTCEDMVGKTSGSQAPGDARWLVLSVMLESCGLDISQVETVDTGADHLTPLVSGVLDTHVLHVDELEFVRFETGEDWRVILALQDIAQQHYTAWVFNADAIADNREGLVRWLGAMTDAVGFMQDPANFDEIAQFLYEEEIIRQNDLDLIKAIFQGFLDMEQWHHDDVGLGVDYLQPSIQAQVDAGNIDEAYDAEDIIDTSLWEEAWARIQARG